GTHLHRPDAPAAARGKLPPLLIPPPNRPDLIDAAMCRRLGLQARFTRLDREGLAAVLDKKIKATYPCAAGQGREEILAKTAAWLFGPGGEGQRVVEVTMSDGRKLVKRRRDFLTGGVVEQAVAAAIDHA